MRVECSNYTINRIKVLLCIVVDTDRRTRSIYTVQYVKTPLVISMYRIAVVPSNPRDVLYLSLWPSVEPECAISTSFNFNPTSSKYQAPRLVLRTGLQYIHCWSSLHKRINNCPAVVTYDYFSCPWPAWKLYLPHQCSVILLACPRLLHARSLARARDYCTLCTTNMSAPSANNSS